MEDQTTTRYPGFDLRTRQGRAYVAHGVWLRVALIGAVAAVAGIAQLVSGDTAPVPALALGAGGGLIAYVGWRRAIAVLDAADAPPAAPAPAPARIGVRAAAGR
jgi:hypothetical protein